MSRTKHKDEEEEEEEEQEKGEKKKIGSRYKGRTSKKTTKKRPGISKQLL